MKRDFGVLQGLVLLKKERFSPFSDYKEIVNVTVKIG